MLSRVADSVYWMSRYIERAENVARFIHVNLHMMLDMKLDDQEQWGPLVTTTGDWDVFIETYGKANAENVIRFLTDCTDNPNSICSCVKSARENARSVREIISSEMWEQLNSMYLDINLGIKNSEHIDSPHEFYTNVKMDSHLFEGVTDATMSHNEGWQFIRMGRCIERADKTSRILDVKYYILLPNVEEVGTAYDNLQWAALLRSASGLEMYRKKYQRIAPERVAEFLILDRDFPRAVHYCLATAETSLRQITGSEPGSFANKAEQRLGRLRADVAYAHINDLMAQGLHEYLDRLQLELNGVGGAVFDTFFALQPLGSDLAD